MIGKSRMKEGKQARIKSNDTQSYDFLLKKQDGLLK